MEDYHSDEYANQLISQEYIREQGLLKKFKLEHAYNNYRKLENNTVDLHMGLADKTMLITVTSCFNQLHEKKSFTKDNVAENQVKLCLLDVFDQFYVHDAEIFSLTINGSIPVTGTKQEIKNILNECDITINPYRQNNNEETCTDFKKTLDKYAQEGLLGNAGTLIPKSIIINTSIKNNRLHLLMMSLRNYDDLQIEKKDFPIESAHDCFAEIEKFIQNTNCSKLLFNGTESSLPTINEKIKTFIDTAQKSFLPKEYNLLPVFSLASSALLAAGAVYSFAQSNVLSVKENYVPQLVQNGCNWIKSWF